MPSADENFEGRVRDLMKAACRNGTETEVKPLVIDSLGHVLGKTLAGETVMGSGVADAAKKHDEGMPYIIYEQKKGNGVGYIQAVAYYHQEAAKHRPEQLAALSGGFQLPCLIIVIEAVHIQILAGHVGQGARCEPLAICSLVDTPDAFLQCCQVLYAARQCVAELAEYFAQKLTPRPSELGHSLVVSVSPHKSRSPPPSSRDTAGTGGAGAGGAVGANEDPRGEWLPPAICFLLFALLLQLSCPSVSRFRLWNSKRGKGEGRE